MPKIWIPFILLVVLFSSCERSSVDHDGLAAPYMEVSDFLVDSLMQQMSLQEKIGQLIIWQGNEENPIWSQIPKLLTQRRISGFTVDQLNATNFNELQDTVSSLKIRSPFVFTKESVFLQNAFTNLPSFPSPINLSANSNFEGFGTFWDFSARNGQKMGINSVEISPIVHFLEKGRIDYKRATSAGEQEILRNSIGEMNAWQQHQALTFAMLDERIYNPTDSLIQRAYPWRTLYSLIQSGLDGIGIDTILYDGQPKDIISPDFMTNFLSEQFEFEGLKISCMTTENTLARAYLSGVDLLVTTLNPKVAYRTILDLINSSLVASSMLDNKVRKILKARIWISDTERYTSEKGLEAEDQLMAAELTKLKNSVLQGAPSLVYNRNNFLPIKNSNRRFRIVEIGKEQSLEFGRSVEFYADAGTRFFEWNEENNVNDFDASSFVGRPILFYLNEVNLKANKDSSFIKYIKNVLSENNSVLINIGFPNNLCLIDTVGNSIIQAFDNSILSQKYIAEIIFGGRKIHGKLPMNLDTTFVKGIGYETAMTRIRKGLPSEVQMDPKILYRLDLLAKKGIKENAFPGCQFSIVKDGILIYEKSFGHLDSAKLEKVKWDNLYDVASVSKVAGTGLVAMREYEKKNYKINDRISKHLELPSKSGIKRVTMKDLLIHRSGIQPNMPIVSVVYPKSERPSLNNYTSNKKTGPYQIEVAKDFYFNIHSRDSIWEKVNLLSAKRRKFRYSDVNFMLLQRIFEKETQLSLDQYADKYFYKGLNLRRTAYKPLRKFKVEDIAPTAHDRKWRMQELRGYVHDEAAALEGGVGGNAGLFANSRDLAVLGQMLLNKGTYGGQRFLEEKTIDYFTRSGHGNHRGLTFDKKSRSRKGVLSRKISSSSYGHTGFTGAVFWVDPKYNLVFIFNTNRIHPKVNNNQLNKGKYRRKMHDAIYRAMLKEKAEGPIALRINLKDN